MFVHFNFIISRGIMLLPVLIGFGQSLLNELGVFLVNTPLCVVLYFLRVLVRHLESSVLVDEGKPVSLVEVSSIVNVDSVGPESGSACDFSLLDCYKQGT